MQQLKLQSRGVRGEAPAAALIVIFLSAAVVGLHHKVTATLSQLPPIRGQSFLPDASALKLFSLGFDQLLADVYWLAFIQYIGDTAARQADRSEQAEKYLDLVTLLDPKFVQAYWFAAFVVGQEQQKPDVAERIINRGIEFNQDNWYLPFIAGVNQYLYAHNEESAARFYRMAAKFPDAPKWLGRQADILQAKIPSLIKEVNTWNSIYTSSKDKLVRDRARERLAHAWIKVFRLSPSEKIRQKAIDELQKMGIEVHP